MFGFLSDLGNYNHRVVARFETNEFYISTAKVSDGKFPIETAVCHPEYNDGKVVVVEAYKTKKAALEGHDKWVKLMTASELPDKLTDCANAQISQLFLKVGGQMDFPRQTQKT